MKNILLYMLVLLGSATLANAQVTLFAGGGSSLGDGGPATAAHLSGTQGICSDGTGNVYVMEQGSGARVRKISPTGIITTVAGHGSSGFSGDGGQATAATFNAYGLSCDLAGNLYISDWNNNRVRKVNASTGIITTIAGNGTSSTSGDGGPATAAGINKPIGAVADVAGNVFISEYGAARIRRVDAATGIISTIATGLSGPCQIVTDNTGNVFVATQSGGRIYKINTSGTVSTIAGGGSGSGSGVPATSVSLSGAEGVAVDVGGNIFIADNGCCLRKVDIAGIITTIATSGNQWTALDIYGNLYFTTGGSDVYKVASASTFGIGYPAIPARSICLGDSVAYGYIGGVWSSSSTSVATINSVTGVAHSISAGSTTISFTTSCCGTLTSTLTVSALCSGIPTAGYAYISSGDTCGHPDTLKLSGVGVTCGITFQWQSSSDGITWSNITSATSIFCPFYPTYMPMRYRCALTCVASGSTAYSGLVFIPPTTGVGLHTITDPPDTVCVGARFYVSTCNLPSSYFYAQTWYGDGSCDTNLLSTTGTPHANIIHRYAYPGTYSVKQIIYDGAAAVDSTSFSYEYLYCSTLPVKFYIDVDSSCTYTSTDYSLAIPISVEVDSNGVIIDTISAISGFYYHALGAPGTIYAFKFLHDTSWVTCPISGIIYDTITSYVNYYPTKFVAVKAASMNFDLAVHPVVPVTGVNDQWGHIYVQNNVGVPIYSTVKLSFDSRWHLTTESHPMPTISGDTATWTLSSVSPTASAPTDIYYVLRNVSAALPIGDIVQGIFSSSPFAGDANIGNNVIIRNDTVKAGCDPNYIENIPASCLPLTSGITEMQYNIHFENTGNDTAHNIYVLDTLSPNLNPRSLKVIMASAAMNISMFNDGRYYVVKFDFPLINLLDSSHHGLCDGVIMYTINTLSNLANASAVTGRAGIYFDTNPVVMTNTAENVIGCPTTFVVNVPADGNFAIYPNPVLNELTIVADNNIYNSVTITNNLGQIMEQRQIAGNTTTLNTDTFPSGMYYVRLIQENGIYKVRKFIKM
jgi:sugar lactone lactonase YvrE